MLGQSTARRPGMGRRRRKARAPPMAKAEEGRPPSLPPSLPSRPPSPRQRTSSPAPLLLPCSPPPSPPLEHKRLLKRQHLEVRAMASPLSEKRRLEKVQHIFERFDVNKDGRLSKVRGHEARGREVGAPRVGWRLPAGRARVLPRKIQPRDGPRIVVRSAKGYDMYMCTICFGSTHFCLS